MTEFLLTQLVQAPGRLQRYMDGCACGRADKAAVLAIKKELEEKDTAIERLEEEIRRRDREKDNLIHMQKDLQAQIQEIRRVLESQASEVAKNGSFQGGREVAKNGSFQGGREGGSKGGSKGGSMDLDEESGSAGLNEVSAAILMQKRVRGFSSRKLAEKKEVASRKLQKIARGRSTRKMMAQKKADGSIMELPGAKRVYGAAAVPPPPQPPAAAGRVVASASKPAPSFAPAQQFLRGSYDEPGRGNGIASGSGLDAGEDESVDSDYDNDEDAFYDLGNEILSGRLKLAKVYGQEEPPAAEDELEWETRYFVLYDTGKMCHFDGMQNGEPVGDRGLIDLDTIKTVEKVLGVPTFVMKGDKKVYLFKLEPHDEVKMRNWIGAITVELSASS